MPDNGTYTTAMDHDDHSEVERFMMPLGAHLDELRSRLIRCLLVVGVVLFASWFVRDSLMAILKRPHETAAAAYYLSPSLHSRTYFEALLAQVEVCLVASLIVCSPYLIHQAWAFVMPALFRRERRFAMRVGLASLACFALGVAFGYFLFIPLMLRFLLALSGPGTEPMIMVGSYVPMLFLMCLALGLAFQTPLVILFLVRWNVVSVETLHSRHKEAVVAAFVVAAVLTPGPDPFTQTILAIPLILLYDVGILLAHPDWRALQRFAGLGGIVVLLGAGTLGYFFLWPAGRLDALEGDVRVRGAVVQAGSTVRLRRSDVCLLGPQARAIINFGGQPPATLKIRGPVSGLRMYGSGSVGLDAGALYAETGEKGEIEVRAAVGQAVLRNGAAEFQVAGGDVMTVSVVRGEVAVRSEGKLTTLAAGRTETFRTGGLPGDAPAVEGRWREF